MSTKPPAMSPNTAHRTGGFTFRQYSSMKKLEGSSNEQHMEQMPPTKLMTLPMTLYACTHTRSTLVLAGKQAQAQMASCTCKALNQSLTGLPDDMTISCSLEMSRLPVGKSLQKARQARAQDGLHTANATQLPTRNRTTRKAAAVALSGARMLPLEVWLQGITLQTMSCTRSTEQ